MAKKDKHKWDLPKPLALIFAIAIILAVPLPLAFYFGGVDWITSGAQAGMKEFVAAYIVGLVFLCVNLGVVIYKDRKENAGKGASKRKKRGEDQ